jgi:hypothetical protein
MHTFEKEYRVGALMISPSARHDQRVALADLDLMIGASK